MIPVILDMTYSAIIAIRADLECGNYERALMRYRKIREFIRFREHNAHDLLPGLIASAMRLRACRSLEDFFLANAPAETIAALKQILDEDVKTQPDFHGMLQRSFFHTLRFIENVPFGSTFDMDTNSFNTSENSRYQEYFRTAVKKKFLTTALPANADAERKVPLHEMVKKYSSGAETPTFRDIINVYAPAFVSVGFSFLKEAGAAKSCDIIFRYKNRYENYIAQEQLIFACHAYRREHGAFPQTLDALVPQYLSSVPEYNFPLNSQTQERGYKKVLYKIDAKTHTLFPEGTPEDKWPEADGVFPLSE